MKKHKGFFVLTIILFLCFLTSCSKTTQTDIFQLEDVGTLDITLTGIVGDKEIPLTPDVTLTMEDFSKIIITAAKLNPDLSVNIYFNEIDAQFPIAEVKHPTKNKTPSSSFYTVIEEYDRASYPAFFTKGSHTVKIFQFDQAGNGKQLPTPSNIDSIKTLRYEVVE